MIEQLRKLAAALTPKQQISILAAALAIGLTLAEAAIILGSVVALFAFFVLIQFQYFFGGQANITIEGYTYAEYARRGFGELVTVAFFALLLFLGLSALVKRETARQHNSFAGLGVALVALLPAAAALALPAGATTAVTIYSSAQPGTLSPQTFRSGGAGGQRFRGGAAVHARPARRPGAFPLPGARLRGGPV